MRKLFSITLAVIATISTAIAQPDSFYLDSASNCYFTEDAIYFNYPNALTKSDYYGNIIWTKHINLIPSNNSHPKFAFTDNAIYGNSDSTVFKIDTAGNVKWIKHFQNLINPVIGASQRFNDVTTDGKYIYVGGGEWDSFSFFKIQATLDSAGNLVNTWSSTMTFDNRWDWAVNGIKSYSDNGVWIVSEKLIGITSIFYIMKVDSSGLINTSDSVVTNGGNGVEVSQIISLPDSSYLILATHGLIDGLMGISITKFDDKGHTIWSQTLGSNYLYMGLTLCEGIAVASDSTGGIYFLGRFMDSNQSHSQRELIEKYDATGNLIWSRSWSDSLLTAAPFSILKMHFHNGSIYAFGHQNSNPAIMVFDTAFNNLCYTPDTTFSISRAPYGAGSGIHSIQHATFPYTLNSIQPANAVLMTDQIPAYFCSITNIQSIEANSMNFAHPNPCSNELRISLAHSDLQGVILITLTDFLGKTVYSGVVKSDEYTIPVANLASGLYTLTGTLKNEIFSQRIIKL